MTRVDLPLEFDEFDVYTGTCRLKPKLSLTADGLPPTSLKDSAIFVSEPLSPSLTVPTEMALSRLCSSRVLYVLFIKKDDDLTRITTVRSARTQPAALSSRSHSCRKSLITSLKMRCSTPHSTVSLVTAQPARNSYTCARTGLTREVPELISVDSVELERNL